jgi:hypothetical protein
MQSSYLKHVVSVLLSVEEEPVVELEDAVVELRVIVV